MIQVQAIKSKLAEEQQQQRKHKNIHKVRVASLPQIERKGIVLLGIDQYADKTIPSLKNVTSDVEAIGKCYSVTFTKEQNLAGVAWTSSPMTFLLNARCVVVSSGGDEPVADEGRGGHSIFAWFLMQALRDVDNWKVGTNIFEQVQRDVRKSFPQIPQYGAATSAGHEKGGDYLFEFSQLE